MKKATIFSKFTKKEALNSAQIIQVKGGDDKRPPLAPPGGKVGGPLPNGNAYGFYGKE